MVLAMLPAVLLKWRGFLIVGVEQTGGMVEAIEAWPEHATPVWTLAGGEGVALLMSSPCREGLACVWGACLRKATFCHGYMACPELGVTSLSIPIVLSFPGDPESFLALWSVPLALGSGHVLWNGEMHTALCWGKCTMLMNRGEVIKPMWCRSESCFINLLDVGCAHHVGSSHVKSEEGVWHDTEGYLVVAWCNTKESSSTVGTTLTLTLCWASSQVAP